MLKQNRRNKKKGAYFIQMFLLIFGMLLLSPASTCMATEPGSVHITYQGKTNQDVQIHLVDAEFVLYKVADVVDGTWAFTEAFEKSGVSVKDSSSSKRKEQAKELYSYALQNKISGNTGKTDALGELYFRNLEKGIYLIAQRENLEIKDAGTFMSAPFLLEIPEKDQGREKWDILVNLKSEWVPGENTEVPENVIPEDETPKQENTEENKTDGAKTGDESPVAMMACIMVFSAVAVAAMQYKRKY